jgi:hypothetical protein
MTLQQLVANGPSDRVSGRKADPYQNRSSLEFGFRSRRFAMVRRLIEKILAEKGRADILDLGGTEKYWLIGEDFVQANRHRLHFTVVNNEDQAVEKPDLFAFAFDSATDPDLLQGRSFDLVHSNSVVEHVGTWRDMQAFAANVRRLAPRYYVQTPNYWFGYEPHFRFPGFQYLPERARVELLMRFPLGFFRRIDDRAEAQDIVDHHRLLSARQMRSLFPDAAISHEKVLGLNKSIVAIRDL